MRHEDREREAVVTAEQYACAMKTVREWAVAAFGPVISSKLPARKVLQGRSTQLVNLL